MENAIIFEWWLPPLAIFRYGSVFQKALCYCTERDKQTIKDTQHATRPLHSCAKALNNAQQPTGGSIVRPNQCVGDVFVIF